ncbi:MAG: hypothetical protein AB7F28_03325, partial [Candidatus Margulisiibacteriota bacterium]
DDSITNADINSAAAIAYSKLNLSNAIVAGDLTTGAVTSAKIADGTIVAADLADGAVTSAKIADDSITNADINSAAAIAYSKLNLSNAIVAADLTTGAVTSAKIADGTIVAADLADGAVTSAKIAAAPSITTSLQINGSGGSTGGKLLFGPQSAGTREVYITDTADSTTSSNPSSKILDMYATEAIYARTAAKTGYTGNGLSGNSRVAMKFDENLLSFYNEDTNAKNSTLLGGITNQTDGKVASIKLEASGADYAEYLMRQNPAEKIKAGDVVGVFGGKISKNTKGANKVMVVSSMPIVLGNWKGREEKHLYEPVAFVGQVPVHVKGKVQVGDYIVASGDNDGTGVAVSRDQLTAEQLDKVIGQAWSVANEDDMVNVAITPMDNPSVSVKALKDENAALKKQLDALKADVEAIKKALNK